MHRTGIATAVLIAATASCTVALTAAASKGNSPPCTLKIAKVQGHPAGLNCGPATARLTVSGKTYTFRNGFCKQSKQAGAALELNLGTIVTGVKGNAGKSYFSLTVATNHSISAVGGADYGGKDLLGAAVPLIDVKGAIPATGTFVQRFAVGAKFTGSWNCHGVVWKAP